MSVIAIVGGGASSLFLAAMLSQRHEVHIFEKERLVGRKLLVAGNGGFNLTHSDDGRELIHRYSPSAWMSSFLTAFGSEDFRGWLQHIGIETYIGSSGRVFPIQGVKPAEVLKVLLAHITDKGFAIHTGHTWLKQVGTKLYFRHNEEEVSISADNIIYGLGGASWRKTGSDGAWLGQFDRMGVDTLPFAASNCGWHVDNHNVPEPLLWTPLKNIACTTTGLWCRGELMLTDYGLEGSPLYMSVQQGPVNAKHIQLSLDLKPDVDLPTIEQALTVRGRKSVTDVLRQRLHFTDSMLHLLRHHTTKEAYLDPCLLAKNVKSLHLKLTAPRPIDEAISSTGGVKLSAVDQHLCLTTHPHTYVIGEMLDWDAPTGGYLLQGCASMAAYLSRYLNKKR